MIKNSKNIGIGIILILIITVSFAVGLSKRVDIQLNSVNLVVNNQKIEADTILYEGKTYIPLKVAAELLNKEVIWDSSTKTVGINDKNLDSKIIEREQDLNSDNFITKEYDVIVVGTDPEGIAAAVGAARSGANTLLVDSRDEVGGLFILGWLNFLDMNYSPNRTLLTRGIFKEFYNQVEGIAFDIKTAKNIFNDMISNESNLTLILNANDINVENNDESIKNIRFSYEEELYKLKGSIFIDATQNGDIAEKAGVPYTLGHEDIGGQANGMAVTQVFKIEGVSNSDWNRIRRYLKTDGDRYSGSTSNTAWGFKSLHRDYSTVNEDTNLRGLNIARQKDKSLVINALQIFKINPLNPEDIEHAKKIAANEIDYIIPYLRENIPGMENVSLLAVAPELYVRESRHFETEYILTIDDVLENRHFEDQIAIGSYPVDVQSTSPDFPGNIIGNPAMYSIPLRSIIPKNINNLLIASRCAGYSSLAFGSSRVVPIGMCVGEAAGTLSALCIQDGILPHEVSQSTELTEKLQKELKNKGAYLPNFDLTPKLVNNKSYKGLQLLRRYGLIAGGYANDYRLDEDATIWFYNSALPVLQKERSWGTNMQIISSYTVNVDLSTLKLSLGDEIELFNYLKQESILSNYKLGEPLTRGDLCQLLLAIDNYILDNQES